VVEGDPATELTVDNEDEMRLLVRVVLQAIGGFEIVSDAVDSDDALEKWLELARPQPESSCSATGCHMGISIEAVQAQAAAIAAYGPEKDGTYAHLKNLRQPTRSSTATTTSSSPPSTPTCRNSTPPTRSSSSTPTPTTAPTTSTPGCSSGTRGSSSTPSSARGGLPSRSPSHHEASGEPADSGRSTTRTPRDQRTAAPLFLRLVRRTGAEGL